jgi:hypothetical protein
MLLLMRISILLLLLLLLLLLMLLLLLILIMFCYTIMKLCITLLENVNKKRTSAGNLSLTI